MLVVKLCDQVIRIQAGGHGNCAQRTPRCCELVGFITTPPRNSWNSWELRTLGFLWRHRQAQVYTCDKAEAWCVMPTTHRRPPNIPSLIAGFGVELTASGRSDAPTHCELRRSPAEQQRLERVRIWHETARRRQAQRLHEARERERQLLEQRTRGHHNLGRESQARQARPK